MNNQPETIESLMNDIATACESIRQGHHRGNVWANRLTAHRMMMATDAASTEALLAEASAIGKRHR